MESGINNISIGYNAIGYSALNGITTGTNCTAIGSAALGTFAIGISSLDNFLITKSILMDLNDFIIKYYPIDSKWAVYNKGKKYIVDNINFISCNAKSILFEHENKKIGCFIVNASKLEEIDNDFNLINNEDI